MSFCLDTNFLYSLIFSDANTPKAYAWLNRNAAQLFVSDWAEAELFALVHRRVRGGGLDQQTASSALSDFAAFQSARAQRLAFSAKAGASAAAFSRDPVLKLSAADALHLALSSENGLCLVTFDIRLAEAARLRGIPVETH